MRVFVSPHLDDAVLSAWVSLSVSAAKVVTCFTGDPPEAMPASHWDQKSSPGLTGREIMEMRRQEDREALALCGATGIHLGLPEHLYRRSDTPLEVEDLAVCLEPYLGDAEEIWVPAGIGAHPDHILAQKASRLVATAATRLVFYADMPYAARRDRGWPISVDRKPRTIALELARVATLKRRALRRWQDDLGTCGLLEKELELHVIDLNPDQVIEKMSAVHTYRTQANALGYVSGLRSMEGTLLAHEVFWTYS